MTRDLCAGRWRLTHSCCPHSQSAVLGRRNPSPGEARALRHGHGASARTRRGRPGYRSARPQRQKQVAAGLCRSRPGCALGARARAAVLGRPPSSAHPGTGPALSTRRPATPQHSGGCRTSHHVCRSRGAGGGWLATQQRNGARSPAHGRPARRRQLPSLEAGPRPRCTSPLGPDAPLTEGLSHGGVGVGVGTTNRPLWRTTALRRGRQHGLWPMGVTSPTLPGPVRCELRDRRGLEPGGGRPAYLPPRPDTPTGATPPPGRLGLRLPPHQAPRRRHTDEDAPRQAPAPRHASGPPHASARATAARRSALSVASGRDPAMRRPPGPHQDAPRRPPPRGQGLLIGTPPQMPLCCFSR